MRLPLALAALLAALPAGSRAEDPAAAEPAAQPTAAAPPAVPAPAAQPNALPQAQGAEAAALDQVQAAEKASLTPAASQPGQSPFVPQAAAAQLPGSAPVAPQVQAPPPEPAPIPPQVAAELAAREGTTAPNMTDELARAQAAAVAADARDAQAAGLPLPAETVAQGADAQAALAANRARRVLPRWGLALGGGFPDFATASVVFRPVSHVRLSAGPSWNYVGWGLHGGVALVPWNWAITPVISLEGGRFFRSDASFLLDEEDEDADRIRPLLQEIDYAYGALDVGFEIGSPRGFSFSFRVGVSHVRIVANGSATYTSDDDGSEVSTVSIRDPRFSGTLPSVKTGFQYWF